MGFFIFYWNALSTVENTIHLFICPSKKTHQINKIYCF